MTTKKQTFSETSSKMTLINRNNCRVCLRIDDDAENDIQKLKILKFTGSEAVKQLFDIEVGVAYLKPK